MIEVELPDGTIVEFPEGTSQDVMRNALMSLQGKQPPANPQRAYMEARERGEMPAPVPQSLDSVARQKGADAAALRSVSDAAADANKPSLGADLLVSAGSGVARGVTGLLDLPIMAGDLIDKGIVAGANAAFGTDWKARPASFNFTRAADKVTGGYLSYEPETKAGDYAQTVGEFLPLGGSAGVVRGVLAPAIASETAGQLTEGTAAEPYARVAGALAGPALVGGAERFARNLISPNAGADPARLRMAAQLEAAGIPITAGQRVGNEALRRQEALTGAGQKIAGTQNEALTRAALKTVGVNADRATEDVLRRAASRIGKVFDDILGGVNVVPTSTTAQKIGQIVDDYKLSAPASEAVPLIREIAERVKAGSVLPAQTVSKWRSALSKATKSQSVATRDSAVDMLDAVDEMIADGLRAAGRDADIARLTTARAQYRNLLAIESAASARKAEGGVLSAGALNQAVKSQGRRAYVTGRRGEIADLSRSAVAVMDALPNSGTPQGLAAYMLPQAAQFGAGATLGGMVAGPYGAMIGGPLGAMVPPAIRAAKMTPLGQRYLSNQLAAPYNAPTNAPYSRAFLNALAQEGGN